MLGKELPIMRRTQRNDRLFELINSMTMSEKRYFKLYANRNAGEQKNYLALFDAFERQNEYDPEAIQNKLKKQAISTRYFAADKNYLYSLILRSLSAFHYGKRPELEIKELLHEADILYERGLYSHCERLLKKAEALCREQENIALLLDVQQWNARLAFILQNGAAIESTLSAANEVVGQVSEQLQYARFQIEIEGVRYQMGYSLTETAQEQVLAWLQSPMLQAESLPTTLSGRLSLYQMRSLCLKMLQDESRARAELEKALELLKQSPQYESRFAYESAAIRFEYLRMMYILDDQAYEALLFDYRGIADRIEQSHFHVKANVYVNSYLAEAERLVRRSDWPKALALLSTMESIFETFEHMVPGPVAAKYQYLIAYVYWGNGLYQRALKHLLLLSQEYGDDASSATGLFSRLLLLLVHTDLGNYELIPYLADSAQRALRKSAHANAFESNLIAMLKKISNKPQADATRFFLEKYESIFAELKKDPDSAAAFRHLDVLAWIQAKQGQCSIAAMQAQQGAFYA